MVEKNPIEPAQEDPISTLFSLFDTLFSSFDKKINESNNNIKNNKINKPSTNDPWAHFTRGTLVNHKLGKKPSRYFIFKRNPFRN